MSFHVFLKMKKRDFIPFGEYYEKQSRIKLSGNLFSSRSKVYPYEFNKPGKTIFKWKDLQKHNTKDDCYIKIYDIVYDVTDYAKVFHYPQVYEFCGDEMPYKEYFD